MDFSRKPQGLEKAANDEFNDSLIDIARSSHKCPIEGNEDFFILKGKELKEEEESNPVKPTPADDVGVEYGGKGNRALKSVTVGCACCGWKMSGEQLVGSKAAGETGSYDNGSSGYNSSSSSSSSYSDSKKNNYGGSNNMGNYGRK